MLSIIVAVVAFTSLVAGLIIDLHYRSVDSLCNSGIGSVGQVLSNSAKGACRAARTDTRLGAGLMVIGIVLGIAAAAAIVLPIITMKRTAERGSF